MAGTTGSLLNPREQDIAHFFAVKIAGSEAGYFAGVEGLSRRLQTLNYAEGGRPIPLVLMVPAPYGELTLRWGHMEYSTLVDWAAAVQVGNGYRQDVEIIHYDRNYTSPRPVRTYALTGAWPVEWRGAALNAEQSQVALEQLSLMYDNLTVTVSAG